VQRRAEKGERGGGLKDADLAEVLGDPLPPLLVLPRSLQLRQQQVRQAGDGTPTSLCGLGEATPGFGRAFGLGPLRVQPLHARQPHQQLHIHIHLFEGIYGLILTVIKVPTISSKSGHEGFLPRKSSAPIGAWGNLKHDQLVVYPERKLDLPPPFSDSRQLSLGKLLKSCGFLRESVPVPTAAAPETITGNCMILVVRPPPPWKSMGVLRVVKKLLTETMEHHLQ